jgi:hypothetical protein
MERVIVDVAFGAGAALVGLLAACIPAWLAIRHALRRPAQSSVLVASAKEKRRHRNGRTHWRRHRPTTIT